MSGIVNQRTLGAVRVAMTLLVPLVGIVGFVAFVSTSPPLPFYAAAIIIFALCLVTAATVIPLIGGRN